ncbi:MAG: S8 family peptidase [Bdellovibrionia bacterium]
MKISLLSLVLASMMSMQVQAAPTASHNGYIIKLKKAVSARSLSTLNSLGVQITNTIPELNLVVAQSNPQLNQKLQAQSALIEYIEPNYYRHTIVAKKDIYDTNADALWGMKSINAAEAWRITTGDPKVVVAISDTGVSQLHGDLQKNLFVNAGESGLDKNGKDKAKNNIDDDGNGFIDDVNGWNFETNTKDPSDTHYHGTHVAGTIGAKGTDRNGITGVTWNSKLMSVKFISSSGSGEDAAGAATIVYAANNGAKVVNCSWGGDEPAKAILDAIEYAGTKGTIVVAAAGNDGADIGKRPMYPAAYKADNLIVVAATTAGSKRELASFSNYNATLVHLAAPGDAIKSSFNPMYKTLYCESLFFCTLSGTSMAAPHVSGAIALLYSVNPKLTVAQVKDVLLSTVTKSAKLEGKVASGGVLNIAEAVKKAKSLN